MIPVQNIYYMLAYAFKVLKEEGYRDIATENFSNVAELCAAILAKGVSVQLKRGLYREYIPETDTLTALRGKLDISESIKTMTMLKRQMVCSFDNFSINSSMNRIIKTTMELLLVADINKSIKKELRKLLVFFGEVDVLDPHRINWRIQYNGNNQTYQMLVSICYLAIKGLLQTTSDGHTKIMDFLDEQRMSKLYEKFVLEYYRKEHLDLKVHAPHIAWQLDDDMDEMLPIMETDVVLSRGNKTLIIDTKYYSKATQSRYGVKKLHSANLYQIFTYVKNIEVELGRDKHEVAGMLLYAKTDEEILPNHSYRMSGNRIDAKTLDLDCDFKQIKSQLDTIVEEYFGEGREKNSRSL